MHVPPNGAVSVEARPLETREPSLRRRGRRKEPPPGSRGNPMGTSERMPSRDVLLTAEAMVGEGITRAIRAHHRRRLRRVGWEHALDAPAGGWAAGDPPPRAGNALEVLVDGAEALPRI